MKNFLALAAVCLAFAACATTSLTSAWRAPDFRPPAKVAVVAAAKDGAVRRKLEDGIVEALGKKGVSGVPSYTFSPELEKDRILEEAKKQGADTILVTALADRKQTETYVPPVASPRYGPGYYGYWGAMSSPGYYVTFEEAITEIHAFDVATQSMTWAGHASTAVDGAVRDSTIREFSAKVAKGYLER